MLVDYVCLECGMACRRDSGNHALKFCSNACQKQHDFGLNFAAWLDGTFQPSTPMTLRSYVIKRDGYACSECGLSDWCRKTITLEVDHIDGRSQDSSPGNVRLLCPNCHTQTPTYGARNMGNGRHARRQRYAQGLSS